MQQLSRKIDWLLLSFKRLEIFLYYYLDNTSKLEPFMFDFSQDLNA